MPKNYEKRVEMIVEGLQDYFMTEGTETTIDALGTMAREAATRFAKAGMKDEATAWDKFKVAVIEPRIDLRKAAEKAEY